jgi:hypothetical protein
MATALDIFEGMMNTIALARYAFPEAPITGNMASLGELWGIERSSEGSKPKS